MESAPGLHLPKAKDISEALRRFPEAIQKMYAAPARPLTRTPAAAAGRPVVAPPRPSALLPRAGPPIQRWTALPDGSPAQVIHRGGHGG
jgi:hypothetical protein